MMWERREERDEFENSLSTGHDLRVIESSVSVVVL